MEFKKRTNGMQRIDYLQFLRGLQPNTILCIMGIVYGLLWISIYMLFGWSGVIIVSAGLITSDVLVSWLAVRKSTAEHEED